MKRFVMLACVLVTGCFANQVLADPTCAFKASCLAPSRHVYSMRNDGVVVRYDVSDGTTYILPNAPAPLGNYISLEWDAQNPPLGGLIAVRDDGAIFSLKVTGGNATWVQLTTLPDCQPVSTQQGTLGSVKAKYR